MVVITGSAGFIGSCLVSKFNSQGIEEQITHYKDYQEEKLKKLKDKYIEKPDYNFSPKLNLKY